MTLIPRILKVVICLFCLIYCINTTFSQVNSDGIPFIKNYSPRTYSAAEPNWAIAQDNRGVMYFGNSQSVLEYDGQNWHKIDVPNQTFVLSLASGIDGKIYVGGVDDFGHLIVNHKGQPEYQSLANLINDSIEIKRVWKIYAYENLVYFCTLQYIFIYDSSSVSIEYVELPIDNFWSFLVDDKLYTGNYNEGLLVLENNELKKVKGSEFFVNKDVFSILRWSEDTLMIATAEKGICLLNTQTGIVSSFNFSNTASKTNRSLVENSIYSATKIDDNHFAFGTIINGLYIINKQGEIVTHLNEKTGLQNETVSCAMYAQNQSGLLWLTLANGISSVNISSPIRHFARESGLYGALFEIAKHNENYYAATMQGVYKLSQDALGNAVFENVEGISGESVLSILSYKPQKGNRILIAAGGKDIYELKGNKFYPLNTKVETHRLLQSRVIPNRIYVATSRGVYIIEHKNGKISFSPDALGLNDETVTKITEDINGNLWCNTISGIKIIDSGGVLIEVPKEIAGKSGVFFRFKEDVYFSSDRDIFIYNDSEKTFLKHPELNNVFGNRKKILKEFFPLNDSLALAFYEINSITKADLISNVDNSWVVDSLSLKIIPPMTIYSAYADNKFILVGGQDGLFFYNKDREKNFHKSYNSLVRSITIGNDSVVYSGGEGFLSSVLENNFEIKTFHSPVAYKFNNIVFSFAASFFEKEEELQYKSFLEGFDPDWSPWQNEVTRTYTNLGEGSYRFFVKAKNIYGIESEVAVLEFRILPPWFRTWWAYLIYVVLAILIVRIFISLYTRKLQEDKRRLEVIVKERTAEIVEKNIRIEHQNKAITDSIRYAKRIQTAVLPNKQTSDLFEYFIYFAPKDIVSGDFYWVNHFEKQNRMIVVAADCTGHGVPGAFMSMLGTSFLNEIVGKLDVNHSDSILNLLREYVIKTLSQGVKEGDKDERRDGMDLSLVSIDLNTMNLEFSGANNPLILIRNNELIEYKPDKMPIGAYVRQDVPFARNEIQLQKGDVFYLFSDGFMDQFGGPNGTSKYMKKRFKEFLHTIYSNPIHNQREILQNEMTLWMGKEEQIDDQLVIGMKVK